MHIVKRILHYVKGTVNFRIHILSLSTLDLYGFYDVDWVGLGFLMFHIWLLHVSWLQLYFLICKKATNSCTVKCRGGIQIHGCRRLRTHMDSFPFA